MKALRYVLPGLTAVLLCVVFPMLYTVATSFTNHSASNLLELARARAILLSELGVVAGSQRGFSLHLERDGLHLVLSQDGQAWASAKLPLEGPLAPAVGVPHTVTARALSGTGQAPLLATALPLSEVVARLPALRALTVVAPDGHPYRLDSLRAFVRSEPLYAAAADGALVDRLSGHTYRLNLEDGFFERADGERLQPGFRVGVGWRHYQRLLSDARIRTPLLGVLVWTVVFAALSVAGAAAVGMLLACLLSWEALRGRALYRVVLFLPYAVPAFLSILIFKGLFNQNMGEINLVLHALFGLRPAWFSDPTLARAMLLLVNIWLGFPYMMVLCTGLLQSIPRELREASAVAGAGPWAHFWSVTLPLVFKPLAPLLIAAFAFNLNNFVLINLLTGGRPDQVDAVLPAGTTDILVSYTWRIALNDSGQQQGLAAAISTVIFVLVALLTLLQLRLSRRGVQAA